MSEYTQRVYAKRCITGGYYKRRWSQSYRPEVLRITGQNYKNIFYFNKDYIVCDTKGKCSIPKDYFRTQYEPISNLEAIILTKGRINETEK